MKTFEEYLAEKGMPIEEAKKVKPWHASKKDIIQMWENLRPGPIQMRPVPEGHSGTRFKWDGIRITGTPTFINSVLARIKDVLQYEKNPGTRLDMEYRQIITDEDVASGESNFVCYIYVESDMKKARKQYQQGIKQAADMLEPDTKPPTVKLVKPMGV